MIETLMTYLQYDFVKYAFIIGILVSLCSSLLGVTLVLKRLSFIGDGLSHVAFGAMAVASVVGLTNNMLIILPVTMLTSVLLLCLGQNSKIKGDAALAMMSVGALAFGYLLMNIFSTKSNVSGDVCTSLFGSTKILSLTKSDLWLCIIISAIVIFTFVFFYNRIFAVTFDQTYVAATGNNVTLHNFVLAVITSLIIVLAMNLVGSLLVSALVIFPALSSMRVFTTFRSVTICSAFVSVFCAITGLIISILESTPVGSTIVIIDLFVFVIFSIIGTLLTKRKSK